LRRSLLALALSCAVLSIGTVHHGRSGSSRGCEPAEPVGIHARVVSVDQGAGLASVEVDVTITSEVALSSVELKGRLQRGKVIVAEDFDLPVGVVPRGATRTGRHVLTMEPGQNHDLLLTLLSRPLTGPATTVTTWVPIPLDAALRPRDAGKVLEFRAQPLPEGRP
jgi:hypothetical protein